MPKLNNSQRKLMPTKKQSETPAETTSIPTPELEVKVEVKQEVKEVIESSVKTKTTKNGNTITTS